MKILLLLACASCAVPAALPSHPQRPYVAVLSGEMPGAIREVARHSWIVAHTRDGHYRRYEWLGEARAVDTDNPLDYFGNGSVSVHGVVDGNEEMVACLEREAARYHDLNCGCWPGPNSNTFADGLIRACGLGIELPATAVGRDYRGPAGVSVTEGRTGVQLETWIFGVKVGAKEGISADITGLSLGVHFWPPGIEVPVAPGRIGIGSSAYYDADPSARDGLAWPAEEHVERRYGSASLDMHVSYDHAPDVGDRTMVGLGGRAVFGPRVGYAFGFDLGIGVRTGHAPGVAYDARLLPVGVGVVIGDTGFVALTSGVGTSNLTSAFELPEELRIELDVTRAARLGLYGGVIAIPFEERPVETFFGARARLGTRASGRFEPRSGSGAGTGGFFLGVERRELFHAYFLGGSFGYEIGVGG